MSIAFLQRLFVYMVGLLMMFSLLVLIPKRQYWFTEMGKYTLYVYLLHGFVIKTFRASPLEQWIRDYQLVWLLVPATLILVYILSSPAVRWRQRDGSLVTKRSLPMGTDPHSAKV